VNTTSKLENKKIVNRKGPKVIICYFILLAISLILVYMKLLPFFVFGILSFPFIISLPFLIPWFLKILLIKVFKVNQDNLDGQYLREKNHNSWLLIPERLMPKSGYIEPESRILVFILILGIIWRFIDEDFRHWPIAIPMIVIIVLARFVIADRIMKKKTNYYRNTRSN